VHRTLLTLLTALVAAGSLAGCEPGAAAGPAAAATTTVATPTTSAAAPAAATNRPAPQPATSTAAPKPTPGLAAEAALVPVVGIVDGDTLKVRVGGRTERVRVIGIDTPELASDECFAQQASSRMQSLVQGKRVRLVADPTQANRDRYDRLLRHVLLADGRSVAQLLIAGGYGREYTYDRAYYGQAAYRKAQATAQDAHLGIWSSGCAVAAPAPLVSSGSSPSDTCANPTIKGNISSEGERIYHVPGGQFYAVTKISTAKGERWFCTEEQARAAGWRASER
jgi:micrococcal nuclease